MRIFVASNDVKLFCIQFFSFIEQNSIDILKIITFEALYVLGAHMRSYGLSYLKSHNKNSLYRFLK